MLSFQRLEVYQRSIEFFALAPEIVAELPSRGHADIADQRRRAAQSQPLNIAEGAGRTARGDIAKHYTIARGSAMECAAILDVMAAGRPPASSRAMAPTCGVRARGGEGTVTGGFGRRHSVHGRGILSGSSEEPSRSLPCVHAYSS